MPTAYTQAKNTLAALAGDLADQATEAGQTTVAQSLQALATEITAATPTDTEFWGDANRSGAAEGWSQIISAASQVVKRRHRWQR